MQHVKEIIHGNTIPPVYQDFHPSDVHKVVSAGMDYSIKIWSFAGAYTYDASTPCTLHATKRYILFRVVKQNSPSQPRNPSFNNQSDGLQTPPWVISPQYSSIAHSSPHTSCISTLSIVCDGLATACCQNPQQPRCCCGGQQQNPTSEVMRRCCRSMRLQRETCGG